MQAHHDPAADVAKEGAVADVDVLPSTQDGEQRPSNDANARPKSGASKWKRASDDGRRMRNGLAPTCRESSTRFGSISMPNCGAVPFVPEKVESLTRIPTTEMIDIPCRRSTNGGEEKRPREDARIGAGEMRRFKLKAAKRRR